MTGIQKANTGSSNYAKQTRLLYGNSQRVQFKTRIQLKRYPSLRTNASTSSPIKAALSNDIRLTTITNSTPTGTPATRINAAVKLLVDTIVYDFPEVNTGKLKSSQQQVYNIIIEPIIQNIFQTKPHLKQMLNQITPVTTESQSSSTNLKRTSAIKNYHCNIRKTEMPPQNE